MDLTWTRAWSGYPPRPESVYSSWMRSTSARLDIHYWRPSISNGIPGVNHGLSALASNSNPSVYQIRSTFWSLRRAQLRLDLV